MVKTSALPVFISFRKLTEWEDNPHMTENAWVRPLIWAYKIFPRPDCLCCKLSMHKNGMIIHDYFVSYFIPFYQLTTDNIVCLTCTVSDYLHDVESWYWYLQRFTGPTADYLCKISIKADYSHVCRHNWLIFICLITRMTSRTDYLRLPIE